MTELKGRHRGKAQYTFAQEEVREVLPSTVPSDRAGLDKWLDDGTNDAVPFFEISDERHGARGAALRSLSCFPTSDRMRVATLLLNVDKLWFRVTVTNVANEVFNDVPARSDLTSIVEVARGLRRAGITDEALLNRVETLSQHAKWNGKTPTSNDRLLRLVQLFSALVQFAPDHSATSHLLETLNLSPQSLDRLDSEPRRMFFESVVRYHQTHPQSLEVMTRLLAEAPTDGSLRDLASVCSSAVKVVQDFVAHGHQSMRRGAGRSAPLSAREGLMLFAALESVLRRSLSQAISFHQKGEWSSIDDSAELCYASEYLPNRFRRGMGRFRTYKSLLSSHISSLTAGSVAMALGVLRRCDELDQALAAKLLDQAGSLVGQMGIGDIGHVASTVAALNMSPTWKGEAEERARGLLHSGTKPYTRGLLVAGFGGDWGALDATSLAVHELVELLEVVPVGSALRRELEGECEMRLGSGNQWFDFRLLQRLQSSSNTRPELQDAIIAHVKRALDSLEENSPFLAIRLVALLPEGHRGQYESFAVNCAKETSVTHWTLTRNVENLLAIFPKSGKVHKFVRAAFSDFLARGRATSQTERQYVNRKLALIHVIEPFPEVRPTVGEMEYFVFDVVGPSVRSLSSNVLTAVLRHFKWYWLEGGMRSMLEQAANKMLEQILRYTRGHDFSILACEAFLAACELEGLLKQDEQLLAHILAGDLPADLRSRVETAFKKLPSDRFRLDATPLPSNDVTTTPSVGLNGPAGGEEASESDEEA